MEDRKEFDQEEVKNEFLESIQRKKDGRYRVRIPWIKGRYPMSDNQIQSRACLNSLFRRMTLMVRRSAKPTGKRMFYMPHKPVVRESPTSTKVRMVFDAGSKPSREAYSISECMNPGPTLQPLPGDALTKIIYGDLHPRK